MNKKQHQHFDSVTLVNILIKSTYLQERKSDQVSAKQIVHCFGVWQKPCSVPEIYW